MRNQTNPTNENRSSDELPAEPTQEHYETAGDHHRMAAHHFAMAAKHQLSAASADDDRDHEANVRHAYLAHRHQLNAVQYAEIAVMDNVHHDDELEKDEALN